jgi:trypsin-like peptidase
VRFEPRLNNVVAPIVHAKRTKDGYVVDGALGTGFPLRDREKKLFLVTAAHVLRIPVGSDRIPCALFFTRDLEAKVCPLESIRFDDATDLACCPISIDPKAGVEVVPFGITDENTEQTRPVLIHEFSYTRVARSVGGFAVSFFPLTHMGNIVGHIRGATVDNAAEPIGIYWLSEQMLEGASGAPVLRTPDMAVCGVVLGNQAELDPVAYLSGEERIRRAFGVAVQAEVVKLALNRMGLIPEYVHCG